VKPLQKSRWNRFNWLMMGACFGLLACPGPAPVTDLGTPDPGPADVGDISGCTGPTIESVALGAMSGESFQAWLDGVEITFSSPGQSSPYSSIDVLVIGGTGLARSLSIIITDSYTSEMLAQSTYTDLYFSCIDGVGFVQNNLSVDFQIDDVFELDGRAVRMQLEAVLSNEEGQDVSVATEFTGVLKFDP